jgi:MYXO-CTERM domain-containing protein
MAGYAGGGAAGARGFCAGTSQDGTPQTLTKYIWEYLGNPIPAEIYGCANITACVNADGCCPSGCAHGNDSDCVQQPVDAGAADVALASDARVAEVRAPYLPDAGAADTSTARDSRDAATAADAGSAGDTQRRVVEPGGAEVASYPDAYLPVPETGGAADLRPNLVELGGPADATAASGAEPSRADKGGCGCSTQPGARTELLVAIAFALLLVLRRRTRQP